jgi:hypothetical protein
MQGRDRSKEIIIHSPLTLSVKNVTLLSGNPNSRQIFVYEGASSLLPALTVSKWALNRGRRSWVSPWSPTWTWEKNWSWAWTLPEEKMARVLGCEDEDEDFQGCRVGRTSGKRGVFRSPEV